MNFADILWPFLISTGLITLNEMGDKSQFLAMAFAARMKLHKVLLGILFAVLALNALAVAVGSLLASVPGWQDWVQFFSSLLFLVFGLWTLKGERAEDNAPNRKKRRGGDIVVVFASFFFSEMGDKTQLVTISLAAKYPNFPIAILLGTTLGMMIADGIGIFAGVVAHHKLPEQALRVASASLFILFGIIGVWQSLRGTFLLPSFAATTLTAATAIVIIGAGYYLFRKSSANSDKKYGTKKI